MENKISVIIPTWNRAYCIEACIRSVLRQTYSNFEILVCDDGSTDNTFEVVSSINDHRVKYINEGRGGCPAIPRNIGIKKAVGEWIAFLDSDDEWIPNKLEVQMKRLYETGLKASSTNAYRIRPNTEKSIFLKYKKDIITFTQIASVNIVICSSVVIHKSLLETLSYFPENINVIEDYAYWLRVASLTDFAYSREPLLYYMDDPKKSFRSEAPQNIVEQRMFVKKDFDEWALKYLTKYDRNLLGEELERAFGRKKLVLKMIDSIRRKISL